jgi:hypothetical protein
VLVAGATLGGCVFQLLGGGTCEWLATRFDPCGTVFANCAPGSFRLAFADVPDYDIDPTCTIPGGCVDAGQQFVSPYDQLGPGFDGP